MNYQANGAEVVADASVFAAADSGEFAFVKPGTDS